MKKSLFVAVFACFCATLFAQDSLFVFKTDGTVLPFALNDVDSISFFRVRNNYDKVNSLTLSRTACGMLEGDELILSAQIDAEGTNFPPIQWATSNDAVATVDQYGVVRGKKYGSVVVTATSGSVSAQCKITVVANSESVYRHGYAELSAADKRIYNYILRRLLAFEANADTYADIQHRVYLDFASQGIYDNITSEKMLKIVNIISKDVPEVYFLANYVYRYDYTNYQYYLRVTKSLTPERVASEMEQVYAACEHIMQPITETSTQFERAKILHDGFIDWGDYGGINNANTGDITGAFVTKRCVCEGFARAYLMLCQLSGLKCVYVVGAMKTSDNPETWGNHAWNSTEVDGNWYLVDTTSDGGFPNTCGWNYFMLGNSSMTGSYNYVDTSDFDQNCGTTAYTALPTLATDDYAWERP